MTQSEQSARFIESAKKAEADESGQKFEEAFTKIARQRQRLQRDWKSPPTKKD